MVLFDPALLLACAATGLAAGILGGMLGIGGGIVIVPALLLLFDARGMDPGLAAPMAVATSLASIVFTSFAAARAQIRRQAVEWEVVRRWTAFLVLGSVTSGQLAVRFPPGALPAFIAGFLVLAAVLMFTNYRPPAQRTLPGPAAGGVLGYVIGLVSGLAGIGGGNLIVPTLVYCNVVVIRATATASALGVPVAMAGTLGYVWAGWGHAQLPAGSLGFVHLPATAAIVTLSMAGASAGVALGHRLPAIRLRRIFAVVLVAAAARVLYGTFAPVWA